MFIKRTKEQEAALQAAKREGKIEAKDLICEMVPLIEDYFMGELQDGSSNSIVFDFPNGQKFILTINEQK